jgi:hypothetical protein
MYKDAVNLPKQREKTYACNSVQRSIPVLRSSVVFTSVDSPRHCHYCLPPVFPRYRKSCVPFLAVCRFCWTECLPMNEEQLRRAFNRYVCEGADGWIPRYVTLHGNRTRFVTPGLRSIDSSAGQHEEKSSRCITVVQSYDAHDDGHTWASRMAAELSPQRLGCNPRLSVVYYFTRAIQ